MTSFHFHSNILTIRLLKFDRISSRAWNSLFPVSRNCSFSSSLKFKTSMRSRIAYSVFFCLPIASRHAQTPNPIKNKIKRENETNTIRFICFLIATHLYSIRKLQRAKAHYATSPALQTFFPYCEENIYL